MRQGLEFNVGFKTIATDHSGVDQAVGVYAAADCGQLRIFQLIIKAVDVQTRTSVEQGRLDAAFIGCDRFRFTHGHAAFQRRCGCGWEQDAALNRRRAIATGDAGIEVHIIGGRISAAEVPGQVIVADITAHRAKRVSQEAGELAILAAHRNKVPLVVIIAQSAGDAELISQLIGHRTEQAISLAVLNLRDKDVDAIGSVARVTQRRVIFRNDLQVFVKIEDASLIA